MTAEVGAAGSDGLPGVAGVAGSPAADAVAGVVLAGGRAARMDGRDKPGLVVDGAALLDHALAALAGTEPLVVVGPEHLSRPGVRLTREEPPFGGPAAGLAAALRVLGSAPRAPRTFWLLAADLPRAETLLKQLRTALAAIPLAPDEDGAIIEDAGGKDQWLAGLYRVGPVARALTHLGDADGAPLRRVVGQLRLRRVPDTAGAAIDLDTWDDVLRYTRGEEATMASKDHGSAGQGKPERELPEHVQEWVEQLAPVLGLDADEVPINLLLGLTGQVAHGVTRPAGPVTTFLLGLAVGAGRSHDEVATLVREQVAAWKAAHPGEDA